jgi:hypothetical protein
LGIFNDSLTDLVVSAEKHHGKRCAVMWRFDPSEQERVRWSCWIECAPDQVWVGADGLAAMAAALRTFRVP